jgi:hypothetical protein
MTLVGAFSERAAGRDAMHRVSTPVQFVTELKIIIEKPQVFVKNTYLCASKHDVFSIY